MMKEKISQFSSPGTRRRVLLFEAQEEYGKCGGFDLVPVKVVVYE